MFRGVQAGGIHLHTKAKIQLSIPVKRIQKTRTRNTSRGAKGSTYMLTVERSKPGEPPRLETGFGRDNTVYEDSEQEGAVRVGIRMIRPFNYMFHHEVTNERSWLRRTLVEEQVQLYKIIQAVSVSEAKRQGLQ